MPIHNEAIIFFSEIGNLIKIFQLKDLLDILIIAVIIYVFVALFVRTKSVPILIGIIFLILLYGLALILNLPLTRMFFNSFFGVFLIILVVIFQKELRRLFEFIGFLGLKKKVSVPGYDTLGIILRAVKKLAKEKTGALIVFPGVERIDGRVDGGIILNGKISEPLFLSIFDDSSPGHDGAVIIKGDKIERFGVHLPLAENLEAVKKFGTRHRAALGLSERSDALCLIVSEERGVISLAYNGEIKNIDDEEELEKKLRDFFSDKFPGKTISNYRKLLKKNVIPICLSLGLALAFWAVFNYQPTIIQKNYLIPVEFRNLPSDFVLDNLSDSEIIVTLSGYEKDFKLLDPASVKISLDASSLKPGWHKILVAKDSIKKPSDFTVVNIEPPSVKFRLSKMETIKQLEQPQ